jgi:hypothetical protein
MARWHKIIIGGTTFAATGARSARRARGLLLAVRRYP